MTNVTKVICTLDTTTMYTSMPVNILEARRGALLILLCGSSLRPRPDKIPRPWKCEWSVHIYGIARSSGSVYCNGAKLTLQSSEVTASSMYMPRIGTNIHNSKCILELEVFKSWHLLAGPICHCHKPSKSFFFFLFDCLKNSASIAELIFKFITMVHRTFWFLQGESAGVVINRLANLGIIINRTPEVLNLDPDRFKAFGLKDFHHICPFSDICLWFFQMIRSPMAIRPSKFP